LLFFPKHENTIRCERLPHLKLVEPKKKDSYIGMDELVGSPSRTSEVTDAETNPNDNKSTLFIRSEDSLSL